MNTTLLLAAVVLVGFAVLGAWYARGRIGSVEDFITARNSTGGGTLTATIVASSMGAWILFSPAETGAGFGVVPVLMYGLGSALPLATFAVIGPRIRRLMPEGHTLTEYAYARYGPVVYAYVLVVSVAYMFVFLAAEFTGIAGALSLVAGVPGWQTAVLVGATALAYTAYGGLRASMMTDAIQALLILPLLVVAFALTLVTLGGAGAVYESVASARPALLSPLTGFAFGVSLLFAVLAAEMLNQAWWQRVYAASDDATLRRSFGVAAVAVVPMVVLAGLFGPIAVGQGLVDGNASVAFFLVTDAVLPGWASLVVALLAVLLVVSSADTLFNAIASVVTADLPRLVDLPEGRLTGAARAFTAVVALAATVVGAQGYSVLTLFLFADLLAAATFPPLLQGLYSRSATGAGSVAGSVLGLAVGLVFFPAARPWFGTLGVAGALPAPSSLYAFGGATVVSGAVAVLLGRLLGGRYDLERLAREVRSLDSGGGESP